MNIISTGTKVNTPDGFGIVIYCIDFEKGIYLVHIMNTKEEKEYAGNLLVL